eukprot:c19077_g1_i1.p1 GENE.c19077_g1_i1~~c19077_g1_i1.p1  ORF type:complete len:1291 (+),score=523.40 c19077_g1_i1:39-3875(+)
MADKTKVAATGEATTGTADPNTFKPGAYQIQVHVIEARDIKASNPSPKVVIDVMGTQKATPAKKGTFSPYFDHLLFWEFQDFTLDHFEYGKINIAIYDTNTPLRSHIIGSYEFDVMYVYHQPNHEVYKSWVAVTDPTDQNEGVQGLVKLSLTVLGPGDKPFVHTEEEEEDSNDTAPILMPPRMKTIDHLLCVQIHRAEGLPVMDSFLEGGSIDPYVAVDFAGIHVETSAFTNNRDPVFSEELQVPVNLPCMTDRITLTVMDKDTVGKNEVVCVTKLLFSQLPVYEEKKLKTFGVGGGFDVDLKGPHSRWLNLYGPSGTSSSDKALAIRKGTLEGSHYLGRLLVTAFHMEKEGPKKGMKKINSCGDIISEEKWIVRLNALQGVQLPFNSDLRVELTWKGKSVQGSAKKGANGTIQWNDELPELEVSVPNEHPPDIFIYLKYGDKRFAYIRLNPKTVAKETYNHLAPTWSTFKPDILSDLAPKNGIVGDLLYSIQIGPASALPKRQPIYIPSFMPYNFYCYLYQAKDLPALDQSANTLDPYFVVLFCGVRLRFKTIKSSRYPVWNEVKSAEVALLQPMSLVPSMTCIVMDEDDTSAHDLAGTFTVDCSSVTAQKTDPVWYPLKLEGREAQGSVLCSFQLVPITEKATIPTSIVPKSANRLVEFTIIGLRNLSPFNYIKIMNPYIVVQLYGKKYETKRSSTPTGTDPNFLECATFSVPLPLNSKFCEPLLVTVYEDRFITTHAIGFCSIELADFYDHTVRKSVAFLARHVSALNKEKDAEKDAALALVAHNEGEKASLLSNMEKGGEGNNDDDEDDDDQGEEETDLSASYMQGRKVLTTELEVTLKTKPFHEVPLVRPSTHGSKSVGLIKGNVFILPENADEVNFPRPFSHTEFSRQKHYLVRLYVIRGKNLAGKDATGLSDPVLEVSLGRKRIFDKDSQRYETLNPEFHRFYELDCILPGQSHLTVKVYDTDRTGYDIIGKTEIDLENYFFSEEWHSYAKKPLEKRSLYSELTPTPQGVLELWVDIIDPRLKHSHPPFDISPPARMPFEMRCIIRKAEGIIPGDYIGKLTDMYVSVELQGNAQTQKKDTDIHWRASDGKGSFNYRIVFDVELPMKKPRLTFQVWDQDIIGSNDALGEVTINPKTLQRAMIAAYQKKNSAYLRLDKDASVFTQAIEKLKLHNPNHPEAGFLFVEVELIPKETASRKPAGEGRNEPNTNPYLPPPVRTEWNLLRPDLLLEKLIGPDLFAKLKNGMLCTLCCLFFAVFFYFFGQFASILNLFI